MAISPPSDLVIDVARAADPAALLAAKQRLSRLGSTAATEGTGSTSAAARSTPASWEEQAKLARLDRPVSEPTGIVSAAQAGTPGQAKGKLDPYTQFEAYVMQSFIQSMLPADASNVYGSGTAGEVWRSMLAEHMATEIARTGDIGIADRIRTAAQARTTETAAESGAVSAPASSPAIPSNRSSPASESPTSSQSNPANDPTEIWPSATVSHT